jgi:hypothetical protein
MLQPGCPAAKSEYAHQAALVLAPPFGRPIHPDFPQPVDKLRVYVRLGEDAHRPGYYFVD